MFKHKRQDGFGIVEFLCFAVMFSMVGLIGWYVINENQTSQETLDNIGGAEVQTSSEKVAKVGDKFVFKEFGIQITLPDDLQGLSYSAEEITSVTGKKTTALYLTSPTYKQTYEKCYGEKSDTGPSFGAIGKTDGKYPDDPDVNNVDGGLLKQFDKFFISGSRPNGVTTCSAPGVDESLMHNETTKLFGSLIEALKTATLFE